MDTIYLDNAATTFPKSDRVYEEMDYVNRTMAVNAGRGSYKTARKANELIIETKNRILNLFKAPDYAKVAFTPSITIALNEILQGIKWVKGSNVYVSPYEHNAVARTINLVADKYSLNVIEIPIDEKTMEIDINKMESLFVINKPFCVCCTHVSNVTGYILPIKDIFQLAKKNGAITVLDSAQSAGLIDIDLRMLEADFVAFAGHKTLYGPLGIGGFVQIGSVELNEVIVGGTGSNSLNLSMPETIPDKYESASSNIVAVAGLKAALEELNDFSNSEKEKELSKYLINHLRGIEAIKLLLPADENKHIAIVSFVVDGFKSNDIGMILDEDYNIAVRTGYHCAPYIHKYLGDENSAGTVRIGLGKYNTFEQIDKLIESLQEILEE